MSSNWNLEVQAIGLTNHKLQNAFQLAVDKWPTAKWPFGNWELKLVPKNGPFIFV
jgi:hypothetical protein